MTRDQLEHLAPWPALPNGRERHRRMLDRVEDYLFVRGPDMSAAQAARRLGLHPRTVQRYRRLLRTTPGGTP